MIQCPICQVLNEDGSLFCAECGQRFAPSSQPANSQPQQPPQFPQQHPPTHDPNLPPDQESPRPKQAKLRSPMLGSSDDDDDDVDGYDKPQLGKLRGTGGPRPEGEPQKSTGKKHLRSPLLGGDDDDFDDEHESNRGKSRGGPAHNDPQENTIQRKKRLHSPLLGNDDDDQSPEDFAPEHGQRGAKRPLRSPLLGDSDDDNPPRGGAKKGSLRSPLLGGSDDDDHEDHRPKKGGLRSPMLGGGEPDHHHPGPRHRGGLHSPLLGDADSYDDDDDDRPSPPKRSQSLPGGKPKLRSALLGGGGYDDDEDLDDEWDEDEDNPDVLRSPLLAAKRKRPKPQVTPVTAPSPGVFGANPDMPQGVQIHKPGNEPLPQYSGQQQPYQGQPSQPQQPPSAPAFPGPSEPQPPWQGSPQGSSAAPPLPGWPGGAQPQPGQPWPPPGLPNPAMLAPPGPGPGNAPPLPAGSSPGTPPWQTNLPEHPAVGVLRTAGAAHEVPPIVDDNDEFQLDISEPTGIPVPAVIQPAAEAPRPIPLQTQPASLSPPLSASPGFLDQDPALDLVEPKPERRNRVERRRTDRRFSNLIEEKSGGKSFTPDDDDEDFSVGRPHQTQSNNAGLGKIMFGLAALALGFKCWYFIHVAGMWNLAVMPDFIAEQLLSGVALLGLIVLALSCMKK